MMNINNNNYELWLLRYAEQELTADERAEVEQWLATHPKAAEELALYSEAPRMERDEAVHYDAAPLHQSTPLWPAMLRWAAAAAVVAVLMVPAMQQVTAPRLTPSEPALIAKAETPKPTETPDNKETVTLKSLDKIDNLETIETIGTIDTIIDTIETIETLKTIETIAPPASPVYVDDLIVFEEEPEAPVEYAAAPEVTYTQTESGVNPIGLFISTFIKANK